MHLPSVTVAVHLTQAPGIAAPQDDEFIPRGRHAFGIGTVNIVGEMRSVTLGHYEMCLNCVLWDLLAQLLQSIIETDVANASEVSRLWLVGPTRVEWCNKTSLLYADRVNPASYFASAALTLYHAT